MARRFVPLVAAAVAKPIQLPLMRGDELTRGVVVADSSGCERGRSRIAGMYAVSMTAVTRMLYLAQPMLLTPVVVTALSRRSISVRRGVPHVVLFVALCGVMSSVATPMCTALFDQRAGVPARRLEAEFHDLVTIDGEPATTLYFNKGL